MRQKAATCRHCRPVLFVDMNRAQITRSMVALCFASVILCCADEPLRRSIRDSETRQVATRCGFYKDAVAKDEVIARAVGHRVIVVNRYAAPEGTRQRRCLERQARSIGYELTNRWVMVD